MYEPFVIDPADLPADLRELDAALLEDLYDLVLNFGASVSTKGLHRLTLPGIRPVHVSVSVPPSLNRTVMVSDTIGAIKVAADHAISTGGRDALFWAEGITVAEVRAAIVAVDASRAAHFDVHGRRKRIVGLEEKDVMRVDEVFRDGHPVAFVMRNDLADLIAQFDRPEDVVHLGRMIDGSEVFCHTRDADRLRTIYQRNHDRTRSVLAKYGITAQGDLDGLSPERRAAFEADIKEALHGAKRQDPN